MKNNIFLVLISLVSIAIPLTMKSQPISQSQYIVIAPVPQKLELLPFGDIKPRGWLKTQMQKDLDGFVGHLDELVPDLMSDSIYGKDRLTHAIKSKNVGNIGIDMDPQYLWWNSETQSNWRDGYIRNAILLDDKAYLAKVEKYIHYILSTQDQDGYLGIYAPDLRYKFQDENGELWAKTTLLRGLLAWYEYTGKPEILKAIEKSVADVMTHYPAGNSSPFKSAKPFAGGVTHGLMFTDVLDRLYQITGNEAYMTYALFLYKDFSENILDEDAQYPKIIDTSYQLKEHGVHTYEQLRSLVVAWYASGNPALKTAMDIYLKRIRECSTPSGGPIGDEWVGGRKADATHTGYEYCSIQELMDDYCNLLQKTAEPQFGDQVENIFFNAAQGARHPEQSCIAYCKTDNSFSMTGSKNGEPNADGKQTRFKYSPAHQDVAVCCVPNAGRISPYYVRSMWMKDAEGLVATLSGPCELQTTVNGEKIRIVEETGYPFGYSIQYHVSAEKPVSFVLKIRKPGWVKGFTVDCAYTEQNGFIIISKIWSGTMHVRIDFYPQVEVKQDPNHEYFFTYGPLVFALPVESHEIVSKTFSVGSFKDLRYSPVNLVKFQYMVQNSPAVFARDLTNPGKTWQSLELKTILINEQTGKPEVVTLKPLGATILRQMTFPAPPLHLTSGWVRRFENFPSKFVDARNVDVWLPDGYDPKKRYAVLYMHDGQMLYDSTSNWNKQEWGVDEVVGNLLAKKKIRDCIVVGIWNNGQYRHSEYFPQKIVDQIQPPSHDIIVHQQLKDKPQADNYLKFIVKELKPFIDSSFSTKKTLENTFVMGSSMGGLISIYALCEYPEVFGGAACLSIHSPVAAPELIGGDGMTDAAGKFREYLDKNLPKANTRKIYFDYGSETLDSLYKPYQDQIDQIMKIKGYTSGYWITREFPGEDHSERAWHKRMEIPMVFLLGR